MTSSAGIPASLLAGDAPVHPKLLIMLREDPAGTIDVRLTVPLDSTAPAERRVLDLFAPDGNLDLRYRVAMNLGAERARLAERIHTMYRRYPVREKLTAPSLGPVPHEDLLHAFSPIAAQGASIFRRLFQPEHFDRHPDHDVPFLRDALRSALARELVLVLDSPVPLFPWAFLYDGEGFDELDQTTLNLQRFWGFRHQIQEEVEGMSRRVLIQESPMIVAAVCPQVDTTGQHRDGPLGRLPEGRVAWMPSALALANKLGAFDADCLYFFGHAAHSNPPTPTTSYLKIDGIELTVERVARTGPLRFAKPLVLAFLNGCETAPLDAWNPDSFAGFLCLRGNHRVACITSFAEVPMAFGAALAQRFWESFLASKTLGESLRAARRDLLAAYGNPLGLLYTVFGRVETRIQP